MSEVTRSAALLGFALACAVPLALAAASLPANGSPLFVPAMVPNISVGVRAMSYGIMNLLQQR